MRMTRVTPARIETNFFQQVNEFIEDNKLIAAKTRKGLDMIVMGYAYLVVGFAQKMSAGPVDPQAKGYKVTYAPSMNPWARTSYRRSTGAWKIPVRRISGDYYKGWYAERMSPSMWRVSNKSREAWFIEFGINHDQWGRTGLPGPNGQRVRIRRPVLKLSVLEAIEWAKATSADSKIISSYWGHTSTGSPALVGGNLYSAGSIIMTPVLPE